MDTEDLIISHRGLLVLSQLFTRSAPTRSAPLHLLSRVHGDAWSHDPGGQSSDSGPTSQSHFVYIVSNSSVF